MIVWSVRHLLYLRSLLNPHFDVHQVALGCALGMMLGLLPKGNLLAVVLTMLLLGLRMHLPAAMVSMVLFSILGPWLDPITHRVGLMLLTSPALAGLWSDFFQLPLAPWTSLNNTVVAGSLVLALVAVTPVYWLGRRVAARLQLRFGGPAMADSGRPVASVGVET